MRIFFLLLFFSSLFADIVEIKSINEIENLDFTNALVIFDIDNTLLQPAQLLGSDQWFTHTVLKFKKSGLSNLEAIEKTLPEYYAINWKTKVIPVEARTAKFIEKLQKNNILVISLTSRAFELDMITIENLKSLKIDFSKFAPFNEELFFKLDNQWIQYKEGILFTSGFDKAKALFKFLELIKFQNLSKIIYIDDKKSPLQEVENRSKQKKIKFVGYRYKFLDEKVKAYNSKIAEIERENFKIISDDEAFSIMQTKRP